MDTNEVDDKGVPTYGPGAVFVARTPIWMATSPAICPETFQNREQSSTDPLRSETGNPDVRTKENLASTQTQARAGDLDRYSMYIAGPTGTFERVRYHVPAGYR